MKVYEKGIVPRKEDFENRLKFKGTAYLMIKDTLEETAEKVFADAGYKKEDKPAGYYNEDGTGYGAGISEESFNIKVGGKTESYLEKQISLGGKRIIVEISIVYKPESKNIELKYKTSEQAAFRGHQDKEGPFMINEVMIINASSFDTFKKDIKKIFETFAKKELAYMTKTKKGIEDKTEKSIDSIVESTKDFSIKRLFESSLEEVEGFVNEMMEEDEEIPVLHLKINSPLDLGNNYTMDHLLNAIAENQEAFDQVVSEVTAFNSSHHSPDIELTYDTKYGVGKEVFDSGELLHMLSRASDRVQPKERDFDEEIGEAEQDNEDLLFSQDIQDIDKHIEEITAVAGGAGAGAFNTKLGGINKRKLNPHTEELNEAAKNGWHVVSQETLDGYKKNHIIGAPGAENVEVNSEKELEYNSGGMKKFPGGKMFAKAKKTMNESATPELRIAADSFKDRLVGATGVDVSIDKTDYVPAMNAIMMDGKIHGEKFHVVIYSNGTVSFADQEYGEDFDGTPEEVLSWVKQHYMRVLNERKMVNRFAEITDPQAKKRFKFVYEPTQDETNDRWKKLSLFENYETIRKAENVIKTKESKEILSEGTISKSPIEESQKFYRSNLIEEGDIVEGEKIIRIKKENSFTPVEYLVREKDFLNENKVYIWDYVTGSQVKNPTYKG
jgi:hypothetical protein